MMSVCQTISFGENQRTRFPEIFQTVAAAGYSGVEIGFRHIAGLNPLELRRELGVAGLKLVASHVGGNLEDRAQAASERSTVDVIVEYLNQIGCNLLMYSGLRWNDAAQFEWDVAMLNRSARRCKRAGVQLLYHNHNWEFDDGGRVINGLLQSADEALGLCPDLGWICKAGADVVAFLQQNHARLRAIHFKDFASLEPVTDTVVLGTGIAPLRDAMAWLMVHAPELPMIAEQDFSNGDPADAVAANAVFLREAWESAQAHKKGGSL